ncbi:MAG: type II toxin-antitoxin system prevent-host-death family antitoxin [Desulfuromonadales bacterium]
MEIVGMREANMHFADYIRKVRSGAEIILTDRGIPVAVIKPLTTASSGIEEKLAELADSGLISLAKKPFSLPKPVVCKGGMISDTIAGLRRDRDI